MSDGLAAIWFENPRGGQRFRLLALPSRARPGHFVLEYVYQPFTGEHAIPAHVHPTATETFEILSGSACYRLGETVAAASAGDVVVLPPGIPHVHPWSASEVPLHVRQTGEARPEDFRGTLAGIQAQITLYGLAAAGKVNGAGLPSPLQLAVLVHSAMPATYLAGIPLWVQRLGFGLLARLGHWRGYRTAYPVFGVLTANGLERSSVLGV